MYYVYVLKSTRKQKRYVGYTSKNPEKRLREHNAGINKFTRANQPFEMIHTESFDGKTAAIKRENFLKSGQGRKWLDENMPW